jgi:hypothetical protein
LELRLGREGLSYLGRVNREAVVRAAAPPGGPVLGRNGRRIGRPGEAVGRRVAGLPGRSVDFRKGANLHREAGLRVSFLLFLLFLSKRTDILYLKRVAESLVGLEAFWEKAHLHKGLSERVSFVLYFFCRLRSLDSLCFRIVGVCRWLVGLHFVPYFVN